MKFTTLASLALPLATYAGRIADPGKGFVADIVDAKRVGPNESKAEVYLDNRDAKLENIRKDEVITTGKNIRNALLGVKNEAMAESG